MSYSALYYVYKTTVTEIAEFRNGHGSGPPVWQWVARKHCGMPADAYIFGGNWMSLIFKNETLTRLPNHWKSVLLFTADFAMINEANRERFAGDCDKVFHELNKWGEWGPSRVNHWADIAATLRSHKIGKRALGVGLSCTSVSDIWGEYSRSKGTHGAERRFQVFDEVSA